MQAGSIADMYACVAEYCLDADDAEPGAKEGPERLAAPPAQPFWMLLSGLLLGNPA